MTAEIFVGLQYICLASKQEVRFNGLEEHPKKCKHWPHSAALKAAGWEAEPALSFVQSCSMVPKAGGPVSATVSHLVMDADLNFNDVVHSRGLGGQFRCKLLGYLLISRVCPSLRMFLRELHTSRALQDRSTPTEALALVPGLVFSCHTWNQNILPLFNPAPSLTILPVLRFKGP